MPDPTPHVHPEVDPATPPVEGTPTEASGDISAPLPRALQDRERGRGRGRRPDHRNRRRPNREQVVPVENPNAAVAQELYNQVLKETYDIVYNRRTEVDAEPVEGVEVSEGDPVKKRELEDEEQSYYNLVRGIAENALGFEYKHNRQIFKRGRLERQRPAKIELSQNPAQHQEAREMIEALWTERFEFDKERLNTLSADVRTKAGERGDVDAVLKERVKNPRFKRDHGGPLSKRLEAGMSGLEDLRIHSVMDAVDWFGARVNQVEAMMDRLTVRTAADTSVEDRIKGLDSHLGFQAEVKELATDLELLQTATAIELTGPEPVVASMKRRIQKQIDRAQKMLKRFERERADLKNLIKINEKFEIPEYRVARRLVGNALMSEAGSITDKLMTEMNKRLEGLTPEQEKQFWSAVLEVFDEAVPRQEKAPRPEQLKRAKELAAKLGLWKEEAGRASLIGLEDRTVPAPGELPKNIGQLVERCKKDATTLTEIREKMRRTFAIMGKEFERATKAGLAGNANEDKVAMVDQLNQKLDQRQRAAVDELMSKDAEFKTALAGRTVRDLKWHQEADRVLINKVRAKIYELLGVGTAEKVDLEALKQLMALPEEVVPTTAAEAEETEASAPVQSLYERIQAGDLTPELIDDVSLPGVDEPTAQDIARYVDKLFQQISEGVQSGPLRDAMKECSDLLVETLATPDDLMQYLLKLDKVAADCKALKQEYGGKWAQEVGLLIPNERGGKPVANLEAVRQAFEAMQTSTGFVESLSLDQNPQAVKALWNKIQPTVRSRIEALGINESDAVFLMLLAIPQKAEQKNVEHSQALGRIATMLELQSGASKERGHDLLAKVNLLKIVEGGDLEFQVGAIRSVIEKDIK